jgi:hypothetical protein
LICLKGEDAATTLLTQIKYRRPSAPRLNESTRSGAGEDVQFDSGSEIHGASVDALQLEARTLQAQVSGMIHHPLNGVLPTLIVRLITIIIRSVKKPAAAAAAHSTQGSRD